MTLEEIEQMPVLKDKIREYSHLVQHGETREVRMEACNRWNDLVIKPKLTPRKLN